MINAVTPNYAPNYNFNLPKNVYSQNKNANYNYSPSFQANSSPTLQIKYSKSLFALLKSARNVEFKGRRVINFFANICAVKRKIS